MIKVGTADMVADIFTKQLPYPAFNRHRSSLGIHPYVNPSMGSVGITQIQHKAE